MPHTTDESHKGGKACSFSFRLDWWPRVRMSSRYPRKTSFHLVISKTFGYRAMMCRVRRMLSLRRGIQTTPLPYRYS